MSRAVVTCLLAGRPDALMKTVRLMPSWRALAVIFLAKFCSEPPSFSLIAAAASLADRTIMP
ncbi:hypothetical protein D3C86_2054170 [compost metagenome]